MFSEKNKERIKQIILPIKAKKIMILRNATKKKLYERKKQSKPTNYAIDKQSEASEQEQEKTKLY